MPSHRQKKRYILWIPGLSICIILKQKKYSLPYLNNAQEYRKLYVYYLKNITITKFALEGSISTWEIDNSRQGTSRKYKCVWSTKQCCEARSFPTITSYSARISWEDIRSLAEYLFTITIAIRTVHIAFHIAFHIRKTDFQRFPLKLFFSIYVY